MELLLVEHEGGEWRTIPENEILDAEVTKIEQVTKDWLDEKTGLPVEKISFEFTITDPEYHGIRLFGETSTLFNTHPNCKLRAWVLEILGQDDLQPGFRFKTEDVIGMPVRIVVAHRKRKMADGSTGIREYVGDVIRSSSVPTTQDVF